MADFIKLELPKELGPALVNDRWLNFIGQFNKSTGAVMENSIASAQFGPSIRPNSDEKALRFVLYPSGRIFLQGSIHKYAANGQNWNDFTFTHMSEAIRQLCRRYQIHPAKTEILRLEVGANIVPPIATSECLRNIICIQGTANVHRYTNSFKGKEGVEFERTKYRAKNYNKGLQYHLSGELLRYEVNYMGSCLERDRVSTLADLLDIANWRKLQDRSVGIFKSQFIAEPSIDLSKLNGKDREFVFQVKDPMYWKGLERRKRHRARARYAAIVAATAPNDLYNDLLSTLRSKFDDLLPPKVNTRRFSLHTTRPETGQNTSTHAA